MNWVLAVDIGNSSVVAAVTTAASATGSSPVSFSNSDVSDVTSVLPLGSTSSGVESDDAATSWMPAAVFITADTVYTGRQALAHAAENPQAFARSPKRFVGADNPRAAELFGTILQQVRRIAAAHVVKQDDSASEYPEKVVLTHPAAWPSSARAVLKDAAAQAGFDEDTVVLVSEPIAAAHSIAPKYRNGYLLVLDVGGGTCDIAVIDARGKRLRVLADGGENTIGGNNFDLAIMDLMRQLVIDEFGEFPAEFDSDSAQLKRSQQARLVREELSQAPDASFTVDDEEFLITRDEFEDAIAPDIERIRALISDKLSALGQNGGALSAVLVGGTVRTPAIAAVVQETTAVLPMTDPISAVAVGAAEYGRTVMAEESAAKRATEIQRSTKKSTEAAGPTTAPSRTGNSVGAESPADSNVTSNSTQSRGFFSSQKTATRIGAVVAGLVIAAAATLFFLPESNTDDGAAAGENAQSDAAAAKALQSPGLHTYPNVDISPLKATVIEDDAPAFKDGYFSCEAMVDAAESAFKSIEGFPGGTPYVSGFGGSSECRFDGNDPTATDTVRITTDSPAGKTVVASDAKSVDDSRIGHWYELRPRYEGTPSEVVTYVSDFGWITVATSSKELAEQGVLTDVAAALDSQLHLRRT